jgi:DNA-binding CsgD family transcriptional regulator
MHASASSARRGTAGAVTPPFVVVEAANPAADAHVRRARETARASGWQPVAGWIVPRGRVACHGVVATDADAVQALRAAVGGAGVIALAAAPRDTIDRLVDDLRRLGAVEHVTADVPAPAAVDDDQRRLLRLLADGWTLGEAAAELGLARRTADRRLGAARRTLGVERTAEALAKARRLGWFDGIGGPD